MTPSNIPELDSIDAVLFDVGDTLVHAATPGTPVSDLQVRLRDDVLADLHELSRRGLRLGAVTDTATMSGDDVRVLLEPSGVAALLTVIVSSCDVGAPKPEPTSLIAALADLGVDASRTLYIGDRVIDRDAAASAGAHFAFIDGTIATTIARWIEEGAGPFAHATACVRADADAVERSDAQEAARERLDALAKPPGSLGRLEQIAVQLCGIAGSCPAPLPTPATIGVFAGDHGVHAEGVTAWPQEITAAMVATMLSGRASINALAATVGATVRLIDVGVATPLPDLPPDSARRVRSGTRNLATERAMTLAEATRALDVGVLVARESVDAGARCLVTGEMGIANTTPSAALVAALTGRVAADVTGRGAGADDEVLGRKISAIDTALSRHTPGDDPLEVLASLGGLEIAALVGFIVGGVALRVPVVVDGVIADAALLVAERLVPGTTAGCIAGHRSTEPAATIALDTLGLEPLLDLDLRLGEGTGAALALPLLDAAARLLTDVATIAEITGG